jgi:hypothetical protein
MSDGLLLFTVGLALGAVAVAIGVYLRLLRRGRQVRPPELAGELRQVLAELDDLTHRLEAQLDERTHQFRQLMAEADQRIAALGGRGAELDRPLHRDPVSEKVYILADAGRSSLQIAQELGEQVGKVELILALRRG